MHLVATFWGITLRWQELTRKLCPQASCSGMREWVPSSYPWRWELSRSYYEWSRAPYVVRVRVYEPIPLCLSSSLFCFSAFLLGFSIEHPVHKAHGQESASRARPSQSPTYDLRADLRFHCHWIRSVRVDSAHMVGVYFKSAGFNF